MKSFGQDRKMGMKLYDKYEAGIAYRTHDFWQRVRGVGVRVEDNSRNGV